MKKLFLLVAFSSFLFSITLVPLTQTLDSKKKKNIIFTVKNPTSEPVAVTFSIKKVTLTDDRKEKREDTNKVSYYPAQFVLKPKESQTIRIRYNGSKLPDIEEIYRIVAKELDVDVRDNIEKSSLEKVSASIKMRFSYEGLLFVHQPNAQAKLKLDSFAELHSNNSSRGISLTFSNSGTRSVLPHYSDYNFFVTIGGKEYKLLEEDLKKAEFRRVLAGKTSTFPIKNIVNLPSGKIESVRLEKIE